MLNPAFGISLIYAQTYENASAEFERRMKEQGRSYTAEEMESYAHKQAMYQTPWEVVGDVAVGRMMKNIFKSIPQGTITAGPETFGNWLGKQFENVGTATAGEVLVTTPGQTLGEAYLAEGAGVREPTTFRQKLGGMAEAMSIALGSTSFVAGASVGTTGTIKAAKGDFPASSDSKQDSQVSAPASPYRNDLGELILERPINATKDPTSAETEARFLRLVNDPQTADRIYDSLPDAYGGKVINPDTSREILPEYRDRQGRMENTVATGGVASVYAKDRFWREITNPRGRKKLVLMAGGPGAGKSTFVDQALGQEADLIFDGTLRDAKWAKQSIDLALEHGWQVSIQYVQRPMEDVFYGIVTRADVTGRWFPIRKLVQAHVDAQRSVQKLSATYKGNLAVKFLLYAGRTGDIKPISLADIDSGGSWNYYEIHGGERRKTLESGRGGDRSGQSQQDLIRENEERLRREIQERQIEERLLRYLARGDEGLLRLIGEVYGHE